MKLGQIIGKELKGELMDRIFVPIKSTGIVHVSCMANELGLSCQAKSCIGCDYYTVRRKDVR